MPISAQGQHKNELDLANGDSEVVILEFIYFIHLYICYPRPLPRISFIPRPRPQPTYNLHLHLRRTHYSRGVMSSVQPHLSTQESQGRCQLRLRRTGLSVWRAVSEATCHQSDQRHSDASDQLQPRGPPHRAVHLLLGVGVQADDHHPDQRPGDIQRGQRGQWGRVQSTLWDWHPETGDRDSSSHFRDWSSRQLDISDLPQPPIFLPHIWPWFPGQELSRGPSSD